MQKHRGLISYKGNNVGHELSVSTANLTLRFRRGNDTERVWAVAISDQPSTNCLSALLT